MILILQLFLIFIDTFAAFTCQGSVSNCPDQGRMLHSSGGNVTITLQYATLIPPSDILLGTIDPYLRVNVNSAVFTSSVASNTRMPIWNEKISLGYLTSATTIIIELWYQQLGFKFLDVLMAQTSLNIPYCNSFIANQTVRTCSDAIYGCESAESLWRSPNELLCQESGSISLSTGAPCSAGDLSCLFLSFTMTPFAVEVVSGFGEISITPQVSAAANPLSSAPWTYSFGMPYIGSNTALDFHIPESSVLSGAVMLRLPDADKALGRVDSLKFYAAINFPAIVYVCRSSADNKQGIPPWIKEGFSAVNRSATRLLLQGGLDYYECFFRYSSGDSLQTRLTCPSRNY